jgi:hypothetical protein
MQACIRRNGAWVALLAVPKFGRNSQHAVSPNTHALQAEIIALDYLYENSRVHTQTNCHTYDPEPAHALRHVECY